MKNIESENDAIAAMQRRLCAITLGDKVDVRTYVHLIKHGLEKFKKMKEESSSVLRAIKEPRSPHAIPGPLLFYKRNAQATVKRAVSVSHAVLNVSQDVRKATIDYLLESKISDSMSPHSLAKVKELKPAILLKPRKQWIPAAVQLSDVLEEDWLLNYQGVRQAVQMNFGAGVDDYLTRVMRPNISALGSMGRGILRPSEQGEEIATQICKLAAEECTFRAALEKYYQSFGHIPLSHELSVVNLYNEWHGMGKEIGDVWRIFWEWADSYASPIPRYHTCDFFINSPSLIPCDRKEQLVEEVVAVIAPSEEAKGQWYEPWLIRADLARYYVEYLESRLPGANSEMITAHSWWLADRVASIFGSGLGDIKKFRERTVAPEDDRARFIWQFTRLATSPSALRYATLYTHNMWSLSLVSSFSPDTLKIMLSAATEAQTKSIHEAISGNLVNLFPIKHPGDKRVYAFDEGCLGAARALVGFTQEPQQKDMLTAFVDAVMRITGEAGIETGLRHLPEANAADQMLTLHTVQIEACMDRAPRDLIWDHLVDYEWLKRVFGILSPVGVELFFDGLKEIQLRTGGKWDQQLPHLYARLCEDFPEDKERRRLFFSFTVISSLAAWSVSAVDRLLKGAHRFNYREDSEDWHQRIENVASLTPHWCRARLRAILASLHP
jgi:hypothetical protein